MHDPLEVVHIVVMHAHHRILGSERDPDSGVQFVMYRRCGDVHLLHWQTLPHEMVAVDPAHGVGTERIGLEL